MTQDSCCTCEIVRRIAQVDLEHMRPGAVLWQRNVDALVEPPANGLQQTPIRFGRGGILWLMC
jgi:hypothetical protein